MGSAGKFLSVLAGKASEKAKEQKAEQDKSRQAEIGVWQKVLEDPNSSPEQRQKAADTLSKLYNWKGKGDSPFHRIVNFIGGLGKMRGGNKPVPDFSGMTSEDGPPKAGGEGGGVQQIPEAKPQPAPAAQPQPAAQPKSGGFKQGVSELFRGHPRELPPLSPDMFPTAEQIRKNQKADLEMKLSTEWPYEEKRLKLQEELRSMTAAAKTRNAMGAKQKYPGEALINGLPEGMRDQLVDANGLPVDPNGIYGPATGDTVGMAQDPSGNKYLTAVRVGTGSERERTSEQWVFDPVKNEFRKEKMRSGTKTPEPPKLEDKTKPGAKPEGKHPRSLSPLKPGEPRPEKLGVGSTQGEGGGRTGKPIPIRVFPAIQKQANAINEARASLIGDKKGEVGGMARDIEIFKDEDSVKRVGQYIKFINMQLEDGAKASASMGPLAAIEWFTGLPATVSNLQQKAISEFSEKLDDGEEDGPEHRFVADYYRWLGTWGGMRAATGASAAKWSFKNLISEGVTPGVVTTYPEAKRRIMNMADESNVVSKNNSLVEPIDTNSIYGGKTGKNPYR